MDGIGKEVQFSYEWRVVDDYILGSDLPKTDNWDTQTKLNFDFNVRGGAPNYADPW